MRTLPITFLLSVSVAGCGIGQALDVASSLTAHELCSQTFVAERDPDAIFRDYLVPFIGVSMATNRLRYEVNRERREVTTSIGRSHPARAAYADGRGCTVMHKQARVPAAVPSGPMPGDGIALSEGAADPRVAAAIDRAFTSDRRAILVVRDDTIVGERYAPGYGPDTKMQSWSMAKSITNALVAILVRDGKLTVDRTLPGLPNGITIDHLLRQTSGQPFGSSNSGFDLSSRMQFLESDTAAFARAADFDGTPGAKWSYTDGNYQILSGIVRDAAGGTPDSVVGFTRRELFGPVGMQSALVELDEAGTPMGASWAFATARDWARFGVLYLDDGVSNGRRLLPEGWVAYSAAPTPAADLGYGAGFWTNRGNDAGARRRQGWGMPADSFFALGNSGQVVLVAPSRRLVIVNLGFAVDPDNRVTVEAVARLTAAID